MRRTVTAALALTLAACGYGFTQRDYEAALAEGEPSHKDGPKSRPGTDLGDNRERGRGVPPVSEETDA